MRNFRVRPLHLVYHCVMSARPNCISFQSSRLYHLEKKSNFRRNESFMNKQSLNFTCDRIMLELKMLYDGRGFLVACKMFISPQEFPFLFTLLSIHLYHLLEDTFLLYFFTGLIFLFMFLRFLSFFLIYL